MPLPGDQSILGITYNKPRFTVRITFNRRVGRAQPCGVSGDWERRNTLYRRAH